MIIIIIIFVSVCAVLEEDNVKNHTLKHLFFFSYLSRFIQRLLTNFSFFAILWQFVLYVPISSHLVIVYTPSMCGVRERKEKILFIRAFFYLNPIQE